MLHRYRECRNEPEEEPAVTNLVTEEIYRKKRESKVEGGELPRSIQLRIYIDIARDQGILF